jgi:hypothetical protein
MTTSHTAYMRKQKEKKEKVNIEKGKERKSG